MKKIIMKKNTCQSGQFVKKLMFIVPLIGFLLLPFKSVFGQVINLCVGQTQTLPSCDGPNTYYLSNNNPAISFTQGSVANNGGNPLTVTGNFPATGILLNCNSGPNTIVTFTVNVNPLPTASVVTTAACNGADDGTATVSGGNSYDWSDGLGTSATQTGLAAGTYTVTAYDANLCASAPVTVIITESSPAITTQPMSVDACYGDDVTFSAAASGGTTPFTYQWQRDCPGSFTDIAGETSASLTLTGIQSFNRCDYRVIITDAAGCELISDAATLDAASPTSVTTQPMPATACGGEDAEFTIVMRSTTVDYQWQSDCSGTFTDIAGATSATYTISAPQASDACNYQVIVTNADGCITISDAVSLTVGNSPTITTQPMSVDACYGDDVTFSAAASGGTAPLTYQWQNDCSSSFTDMAGETSASLTIAGLSAADRCDYRVIITDAAGCTVTSDAATLDAASPTSVTTQPMPATVCAGDDAEFTIVMRSTTVTFQWQSNCSGTFMDITGATSNPYTLSAAQTTDACNYQVVVTNADGCITISDAAALTIIPTDPPTATTTDFTICEGDAIPDFEADEIGSLYSPCTINWFDAPTAGNMVGTGNTFNSNGATGEESTTVDTNTPGTYTFYAEADCSDCLSDSRTPFTLNIEVDEPQCIAQDITITLDGTGNATISPDDIDNGSMLGCAGVGTLNLSLDQTTFTCDDVLTTNTVTLTVDDGNGNMSTCMATVTVLPDASCTKFDCPPTQISCTGEPFNLNPTDPGGTYGGTAAPFVMNDILNPTGMPPGSYTLTYTVNGITSEVCEFIVVRPTKTANAGSLRN